MSTFNMASSMAAAGVINGRPVMLTNHGSPNAPKWGASVDGAAFDAGDALAVSKKKNRTFQDAWDALAPLVPAADDEPAGATPPAQPEPVKDDAPPAQPEKTADAPAVVETPLQRRKRELLAMLAEAEKEEAEEMDAIHARVLAEFDAGPEMAALKAAQAILEQCEDAYTTGLAKRLTAAGWAGKPKSSKPKSEGKPRNNGPTMGEVVLAGVKAGHDTSAKLFDYANSVVGHSYVGLDRQKTLSQTITWELGDAVKGGRLTYTGDNGHRVYSLVAAK